MTPSEIATVLAKAAAYDRRTVGRADVAAWHEVLADIDLPDALTAVSAHYRTSAEWLQPAHIRSHVRDLHATRRGRERASAPLALPSRYETDDERDRRIAAGIAAVREQLPDESPAARHQRLAIARSRKERGRPERQAPRRKRKPPKDWPPPQSDEIASLATRYLIDGYPPADVAERLGVSRKWCQRTDSRMRPAGQASQPTEESL